MGNLDSVKTINSRQSSALIVVPEFKKEPVGSAKFNLSTIGETSDIVLVTLGDFSWVEVDYKLLVESQEEIMNREVISRYQHIPQVTLITRVDHPSLVEFIVYTDNLNFDYELMTTLIGQEPDILDLYPNRLLDFHYRSYNPRVHEAPPVSPLEKIIHEAKQHGGSSGARRAIQAQ